MMMTSELIEIANKARDEIFRVLLEGERKGKTSFTDHPDPEWHIRRMIAHGERFLAGDRTEDNLSHALTRAAMALELKASGER